MGKDSDRLVAMLTTAGFDVREGRNLGVRRVRMSDLPEYAAAEVGGAYRVFGGLLDPCP